MRYYHRILWNVFKNCKTRARDWLGTSQHVFGLLTGKVHSHHPYREIEDEDLENTLSENYMDEVEPLDKYEDNNEERDVDEMDEQLADPRAYPRPKPFIRRRWIRRISISCTIRCGTYNWCRVRSRGYCHYPNGCICTRFA